MAYNGKQVATTNNTLTTKASKSFSTRQYKNNKNLNNNRYSNTKPHNGTPFSSNNYNNRRVNNFSNKNNMTRASLSSLYVRNLPSNLFMGINQFKKAMQNLPILQLDPLKTFLNKDKDLSKIRQLSPVSENLDSHIERIDEYLNKFTKLLIENNTESSKALTTQIDDFNTEWLAKHDSIPDLKDKLDNENDIDYRNKVNDIKKNLIPKAFCHPNGSDNKFQYITNCIKLINSHNTICFSFDIEAYERDNNVITEIGISIYDPRDNLYTSFNPVIRSFHLIISESLNLINKSWVCDMKQCFILGESMVMTLDNCVKFIQDLINFYMVPLSEDSVDNKWNRSFVGHNIEGDFKWLKSMNIQLPKNLSYLEDGTSIDLKAKGKNTVYVMDTFRIYRYLYSNEGGNLGKLLRLFSLPHAFLHNAGNDSYYTLKLLFYICDINTREKANLDNFILIQKRIKEFLVRSKEEEKIIPMSYGLTINQSKSSYGTKKKDLVPQTEFGGARYIESYDQIDVFF